MIEFVILAFTAIIGLLIALAFLFRRGRNDPTNKVRGEEHAVNYDRL